MLIDFTVENYRSIGAAVTLSAVTQNSTKASSRRRAASDGDANVAEPFEVEGRNIRLLPVIGIFGANASGKSNLIRALKDLYDLIILGARREGVERYRTSIVPFKLHRDTSSSPTRFRVRAVVKSGIYDYSLSIKQHRIVEEELKQIPPPPRRMQSRLLYSRRWDSVSEGYVWKNGKAFSNKYIDIQKATKQDEPFFNLLVNRLEVPAFKDFVYWVVAKWPGISLGDEYAEHETILRFLKKYPEMFETATNMLKRFDTGIADLQMRERKPDESSDANSDYELWALHKTPKAEIWWPFSEESVGTQRLFDLIAKLLIVFNTGGMVTVDELSANIHPQIVRIIIRLFQSSQTNPRRAQLIFTSHDYTLQKPNLLRRDQIWFTQKRDDGSTELYPLSDFHPRNDLALDKAYIEGRFGAVPILPEPESLILRK
jgi:uncharacterized protein